MVAVPMVVLLEVVAPSLTLQGYCYCCRSCSFQHRQVPLHPCYGSGQACRNTENIVACREVAELRTRIAVDRDRIERRLGAAEADDASMGSQVVEVDKSEEGIVVTVVGDVDLG